VYSDAFNDRLLLQQATLTDDAAGGQTVAWQGVTSLPCYIGQLSSAALLEPYQREGHRDVYRVQFSDSIVRTDGEVSLHRLLRKAGETRFRFLWQGDRTLTPVGMIRPTPSIPELASMISIDVVETPEGIGYVDL